MRLRIIASTAIFCAFGILAGSRADASIIGATYDLTDFNKTNGTVIAPYDVVKLIGNTTAGTVTFNVSRDGRQPRRQIRRIRLERQLTPKRIDEQQFHLNHAADFSVTGGSQSLGGYGKFNWVLDVASGKANRVTTLSFTISGINALVGNSNWTLTSDTGSSEILFSPANKGNLFVSDFYPPSTPNGFVSEPAFVALPNRARRLLLGLGTVRALRPEVSPTPDAKLTSRSGFQACFAGFPLSS